MDERWKDTVMHPVVIAGGGPTGLMLAAELRLAGVAVVVLERRTEQELDGLRAGGLHMRTLELLDQRGIVERFLAEGTLHRAAPFARGMLPLDGTPTRHDYFLALWQVHVERLLAAWAESLGVTFMRGRELSGFVDDGACVRIELADGGRLCAQYLVGCDGGRSCVRKCAGIEFPGWEASTRYLIAELTLSEEPAWGIRHGSHGIQALGKLEDGRARVVLSEPFAPSEGPPTLDELRTRLHDVYGTDYGLRSASHLSRFTDATRQAASYRVGRVLLAGDAAHVHSPVGGQGLNVGLHDAVNLGWKLGLVVSGQADAALLDSYHEERHPAGARVLRATMALTALDRGDARSAALRETLLALMENPGARASYVASLAGLDVRYALGEGHALLGRRMPDLTLEGAERVYPLLHAARPLLLDFTGELQLPPGAWRLRHHVGRCLSPWVLPVIGDVPAPSAVLVRPDGYVAWVGQGNADGLAASLARWCGTPHVAAQD